MFALCAFSATRRWLNYSGLHTSSPTNSTVTTNRRPTMRWSGGTSGNLQRNWRLEYTLVTTLMYPSMQIGPAHAIIIRQNYFLPLIYFLLSFVRFVYTFVYLKIK
ncbi:unnamed protein product [Rodentolepis nana]|uniref:Uncharacterized protein n=1 Tax=Rodentolepis nana TaxID=102285 RepID=A0A3P7T019_RODNA|nr:unnamed protein product [Rodentolepis nana]